METHVCSSHVCASCQLVFLFLFPLEQGAQIQVHPCVSRFSYHTPLKAEVSIQVLSVSPSGSQIHFLHDSCTKFPYLSPDGLWGTQVLQSLTPSHVLLSWGLQDWSRPYSSVLGGQDTHPKTSRPWTASVGCRGTCAHTHLHTNREELLWVQDQVFERGHGPQWASLVAQLVKNLPAMQEIWVQSLG